MDHHNEIWVKYMKKSKKEQGYEVLLHMLCDDMQIESDDWYYVIAKACEEMYSKDSEQFKLMEDLLSIDKEKYVQFVEKYCGKNSVDPYNPKKESAWDSEAENEAEN